MLLPLLAAAEAAAAALLEAMTGAAYLSASSSIPDTSRRALMAAFAARLLAASFTLMPCSRVPGRLDRALPQLAVLAILSCHFGMHAT